MLTGQTLVCENGPSTQISFVSSNGANPCVYTLDVDALSINMPSSFITINGGTCTNCPNVVNQSDVTWTITGNMGDPCGSVSIGWAPGSSQGFCGSEVIQLPVELLAFNAIANEQNVLLQWQTASEENNSGFEVQRSKDAQNWEVLDFVKGYGTTIEIQNYKWLDKTPLSGTSYYQLKQIDTDGTYEYSEVIVVDMKLKQNDLEVSPNPTTDFLSYQVANMDDVRSVQLFDVYGKLLKVATQIDGTLSLADVNAGMYLLVVETNSGRMQQMVVKQ